MFLDSWRISRWRSEFRAAHPFLDKTPAEPERLRLILGVGRSGTSWVSQALFKNSGKSRCYSEPLFHIVPRLPFHKKADHTSVGYEALPAEHPLALAFQLLTHRQFSGTGFKPLERDDAGWEICLAKEVHALLGAEGLLKLWKTPVVFILRDPIYIMDSLFAAQTPGTIYLDHEVKAVQKPEFLDRFAAGRQAAVRRLFNEAASRGARERTILEKFVCAQLLQDMFQQLTNEFPQAKALRYEDLCASSRELFPSLAAALGIKWNSAMDDYLASTMKADETSSDPYSIKRNTQDQRERPLKFLSAAEAAACREAARTIKGDTPAGAR